MKIKKFFTFIKNNWLSAVMLALAMASALVGLFWPDDKLSVKALSLAIALIAGDLFLLIWQYLESIQNAIKDIKSGGNKGYSIGKQEDQQMDQIITEAREELFFCGWALSWLNRQKLLTISNKVHIRLLALDLSNEEAKNSCIATFGRPPGLPTLDHFDWFSSRDNFEIRTTKFPVAVQISARDMQTATGNIQVAFQEYGAIGYDTPCIEFVPTDTEWYDFYKNQIELLWAQGTPWTPTSREDTEAILSQI